jgi:Serine carboxypeptidase S28
MMWMMIMMRMVVAVLFRLLVVLLLASPLTYLFVMARAATPTDYSDSSSSSSSSSSALRENGVVSPLLSTWSSSIPAPAQYFDKQLVDHLSVHPAQSANKNTTSTNTSSTSTSTSYKNFKKKYWTQRYYTYDKHFQGPGHPVFLIMGGEGAMEPSSGIYYPLIAERYASAFGAYVLQPEHRFYGASQPIIPRNNDDIDVIDIIDMARRNGTLHHDWVDPRVQLLTSEQALHDAIRLLQYTRFHVLHCSRDRFAPTYCPVIIVGGSYPGFLAAMGRLRFPHVIDMAYAASAPIQFYAQQINETTTRQYDYYNHISTVAETAHAGCAAAVSSTLSDFKAYYYNNNNRSTNVSIDTGAIGICNGTLPGYIIDGANKDIIQTFIDEVIMMVGYTFANANMAYYPPSNSSNLYRACAIFYQNSNTNDNSIKASLARLKEFFVTFLGPQQQQQQQQQQDDSDKYDNDCFDMTQQLPTGPHATISAGDWSGVGPKSSGESWDFQTCTLLIEAIGFGPDSMFATTTTTTTTTSTADANSANDATIPTSRNNETRHGRDWSLDWLTRHCQERFGAKVVPRPHALVDAWHFDPEHLVPTGGASRIIFTNGMRDGWSVSGVQSDLSHDVLAINFPNGAHHSDLNGLGNQSSDTSDIQEGTRRIQDILATWLAELPSSFSKMQQ